MMGKCCLLGRVLLFFYHYIDLVIQNPTDKPFQIRLHVGDHQLEGEFLCNEEKQYSYYIDEKQHAIINRQGVIYRKNEIWKDTMTKKMLVVLRQA